MGSVETEVAARAAVIHGLQGTWAELAWPLRKGPSLELRGKKNSLQMSDTSESLKQRPRRRGDGSTRQFEEEQAVPRLWKILPALAVLGEGKPPASPRGSQQSPGLATNLSTKPREAHRTYPNSAQKHSC